MDFSSYIFNVQIWTKGVLNYKMENYNWSKSI